MIPDRPLRFHWSLSQAGNTFRRSTSPEAMAGVPDFGAQLALCRLAEGCGIESMLMAIGHTRPDPMLLSVALGREARRVGFMIACRPSLVAPEHFVRQLDTVSMLLGGRASVNVVGGHTPRELGYYGCFLDHDARFEQAGEFLETCRGLWRSNRGRGPEIYLGGNSPKAASMAARHASCLFRFAEAPEALRPQVGPVLEAGKEVGLLVALLGRATRGEAVEDASAMIARLGEPALAAHRDFERATDSSAFLSTYERARRSGSGWLTDVLWAGAVPYLGAPSIALVGSADDIAGAILEYRRVGVSQFLFLGWPDLDEMAFFGREILPRVRQGERDAGIPAEVGGPIPCP